MSERLSDVAIRIQSVRQLSAVVGAMQGIAAARSREARSRLEGVQSYARTIATAIGVAEISRVMKQVIDDRIDLLLPMVAVVAIGFVVLTLPVGLLTTRLSEKLAVKR